MTDEAKRFSADGRLVGTVGNSRAESSGHLATAYCPVMMFCDARLLLPRGWKIHPRRLKQVNFLDVVGPKILANIRRLHARTHYASEVIENKESWRIGNIRGEDRQH